MSTLESKEILIVEDELPISTMIAHVLKRAGYGVLQASDAEQARRCIEERPPALVLLDWMLPGVSGLELMRAIRSAPATRRVPVVFLTARVQEADKVVGLDCGADDYITKPFSTRELLARIQTVLRRGQVAPRPRDQIALHGLVLDHTAHRLTAGSRYIHLSPTEYELISLMMGNEDRAFTRDQLLECFREEGAGIGVRAVDVHVLRLRKVLEPFGFDRLIQTVRGVGYRFSARGE